MLIYGSVIEAARQTTITASQNSCITLCFACSTHNSRFNAAQWRTLIIMARIQVASFLAQTLTWPIVTWIRPAFYVNNRNALLLMARRNEVRSGQTPPSPLPDFSIAQKQMRILTLMFQCLIQHQFDVSHQSYWKIWR